MKRCVVVGAGEFFGINASASEADYIIAADGGYDHLLGAGVKPHIAIGDFDSLSAPPDTPSRIALPREKDDTDMMVALRHALSRGYRHMDIYGGTGGRFDHTFANIQALAYLARQGARGYLVDEHCVISCIHNDTHVFAAGYEGMLSVFSLSERARGVTLTGLKYTLKDAELCCDNPQGVSNEFLGVESAVSVREGTLLLIYPKYRGRIHP